MKQKYILLKKKNCLFLIFVKHKNLVIINFKQLTWFSNFFIMKKIFRMHFNISIMINFILNFIIFNKNSESYKRSHVTHLLKDMLFLTTYLTKIRLTLGNDVKYSSKAQSSVFPPNNQNFIFNNMILLLNFLALVLIIKKN